MLYYLNSFVVGVAQLVERLTVAQNVAGSSPVSHPIFFARNHPFSYLMEAGIFLSPNFRTGITEEARKSAGCPAHAGKTLRVAVSRLQSGRMRCMLFRTIHHPAKEIEK